MIPAELPHRTLALRPESRVLLAGSCFAEHIGGRMARSGLRAEVNPFGVLYNPESLRRMLLALLDGRFDDAELFEGAEGAWHSWLHSGAFSAPSRDECLARVAARFEGAATALRKADVLFLTFGTSVVYFLPDGRVAGNCHKQPARMFTERRLEVEEILAAWHPLLARLEAELPALQVVFTISPYRYLKYGLHGSQLAKAVLLLAVDALCRSHESCLYFPAYEMVTDELRDYRFYEADMAHPSSQAVDYVWERLGDWAFTPALRELIAACSRVRRDAGHRPLHPGSGEHERFLAQAAQRREELCRRYPWLTRQFEEGEVTDLHAARVAGNT